MEQTSIEWLENALLNRGVRIYQNSLHRELFKEAKEMQKRDNALFLRWFTKHYSIKTIDGFLTWVDSMDNEVAIEKIIEHYYSNSL
jgi:hypothetical protein